MEDACDIGGTKRKNEGESESEIMKRMCMEECIFKNCEQGIKISNNGKKISRCCESSSVIIGASLDEVISERIYFIKFVVNCSREYDICFGYENETAKEVVVINNSDSYTINANGIKTKCNIPIRFEEDGSIEIVYNTSSIATMYVLCNNVLHEIFKMKKPVKPFIGITHEDDSVTILDYRIDFFGKVDCFKVVNGICGIEDIGCSSYINAIIQCLISNKALKDEICNMHYTEVHNLENSDLIPFLFSKIIKNISKYENYEELYSNLFWLKSILVTENKNICDCDSFLNCLKDNLDSTEIKKYTFCEYKEDSNYNVSTDFLVIKISF